MQCNMQLLVNGWGRVTTLLIVLIFQLDFLPGEVGGEGVFACTQTVDYSCDFFFFFFRLLNPGK